ncbi:T9SS type A sorting domain-containing protein [Aquimarina sp. RZ0]|uniref:T9SS type A sorting domain-containing protein n=1 Tax=Aquimarina sp. RZ0 TaxID=2607730 RepID=UPI0011F364F7|nr:T9SS type A sorting domain-containing protein [Aquimarina sp. RZ0]KAA1248104.1 T9SS type A sorting domain-containing protein [Aquimarina sp. RZ0]
MGTEDEDTVIENFKLFPNPVEDLLNVDVLEKQTITATIFSLEVKKILTKKVLTGSDAISLSRLSSGLYILELETGNKSYKTKIVKQ